MHTYIQTHTRTYTYICVCVCVRVYNIFVSVCVHKERNSIHIHHDQQECTNVLFTKFQE